VRNFCFFSRFDSVLVRSPNFAFLLRRFGTALIATSCAFLLDLYGAYDGDDVCVGLKTSNF
jgi:chromosome condensin MukBEF MukE localization factor